MKLQSQIIIEQLLKKGEVSRNWALSKYISRLGAIIQELIKDGWKFDEHRTKAGKEIMRGKFVKTRNGSDYVYTVVTFPKNYKVNK